MQKICANSWCQQSFKVTDDDLAFYEKVSPVFNGKKEMIPPPSLCPTCRMQRRMLWRNELHVFLGKSALSGTTMMTQFSPNTSSIVYSVDEWHSDTWDPKKFNMHPNEKISFFSQFHEQMNRVPHVSRAVTDNENCEYANSTAWSKNCYMVGGCSSCEDCAYSYNIGFSKNCLDCAFVGKCERCYECVQCRNCYRVYYSTKCVDCRDSAFLVGCLHCSHCFGSANLVHKNYCFFNEQLTKEEYEQKMQTIDLGSREQVEIFLEKVSQHWLHFPRKYMHGEMNEEVTGNNIFESKNAYECFDASELQDCRHCWTFNQGKDCRDCYGWGRTAELCYECTTVGDGSTNVLFSAQTYGCNNVLYSFSCQNCQHLFGCISMKNASYCIFNTQYTKNEYEMIVSSLLQSMRKRCEWGEFFPMNIAPFRYNTSSANDYFPLSEPQAAQRKIPWFREFNPKNSSQMTAPNTTAEIKRPSTYSCRMTGTPYKIIDQEIRFYKEEGLPPPDVCFAERSRRRFISSDPHTLWLRPCHHCSQQIHTIYSPDRPEIVYCESCYRTTVY